MPKGKHNVAELRKHQIMLRLNDSEFAEVSTQAKKFHQPIAVYVRDAILKTSSSVPYQICVDLGDIQSLVTEYSRIGNNLNQIAKYFHTGGLKSQEIEFEIKHCITQLFQLRTQLMKMGEGFYGNIKTHI